MSEHIKQDKKWFRGLPAVEQARIRDLHDQISRLAFRSAGGVLIAPPDASMDSDAGVMFNGSCFVLKLPRGCFLCTAWHVLEHWLRRRASGEPVLFQVGELALDVPARLAWKDEEDDLAFLYLRDDELALVGAEPHEPKDWPPLQPQVGQHLVIAGFPGQLRERESVRDVAFKSFTARLEVSDVRERFVMATLDRDYWEEVRRSEDPPATLALGGMSGGPVLLVGELNYPIVGIVSCVSELPGFAFVRLCTLAHVHDLPTPAA